MGSDPSFFVYMKVKELKREIIKEKYVDCVALCIGEKSGGTFTMITLRENDEIPPYALVENDGIPPYALVYLRVLTDRVKKNVPK